MRSWLIGARVAGIGLALGCTALVGCAETGLLASGESCVRSVQCQPGLGCINGVCGTDTTILEGGVVPSMDGGAAVDAGPAVDAGDVDAGPAIDAGDVDAGPPMMDAGPPMRDAGPPMMDAGPPMMDAGPPMMDSGPPIVDSGAGDGG